MSIKFSLGFVQIIVPVAERVKRIKLSELGLLFITVNILNK
jgi:hypothetical protein